MGYNEILFTRYLFSQIVCTKWEQNHRALDTSINNDYIEFDTKQAENTKMTERRKTSFRKE